MENVPQIWFDYVRYIWCPIIEPILLTYVENVPLEIALHNINKKKINIERLIFCHMKWPLSVVCHPITFCLSCQPKTKQKKKKKNKKKEKKEKKKKNISIQIWTPLWNIRTKTSLDIG